MRENRTSGSEGGAAEANRPFLPLFCDELGSLLCLRHSDSPRLSEPPAFRHISVS